MKTVFTNSELPHIWASDTQASARSNSMHFEGAALFSYQTVIARRITSKVRKAYVLDGASFSNSTSKHQILARRAIPEADPVFHVSIGDWKQSLDFTPAELRDWFLAEFRREVPSRYAHMRAGDFRRRFDALSEARRVCAVFGLGDSALAKIAGKLTPEYESAGAVLDAHHAKLETRRQTLWANRRARADAAEVKRRGDLILKAEGIAAGTEKADALGYRWEETLRDCRREDLIPGVHAAIAAQSAADVAAWITGADVYLPYDCPTLLRVNADEMETSKGARVPLVDAARTYAFASRLRAMGWHRNGETHSIGRYQLDAVNESGVVAGCHRVTWAEIDRFAASQNWITSAAT